MHGVKNSKRELPNDADTVDGEPAEYDRPNGQDTHNAQSDTVTLVEVENENSEASPDTDEPKPRHDAEEIASPPHKPAILPRAK